VNAATSIPEMNLQRSIKSAAFTLMELLVVIAIMAIIAGLVVGLSNVAGEKKRISRAQVERERLVTLIEAYKLKLGVYPPSNPSDPGKNTLLYELAGATNSLAADPNFVTPFGSIRASVLMSEFGIAGIVNSFTSSADDITEFKRFLKYLKPEQFTATGPNNVLRLVFPADGPNGRPNFWKYATGTNALRNPDSFDLWVEIAFRNKTNIVGNWKE
jgi:prepilin-type N-terminal cleavage/methylation domain-containing protein